MELEAKLTLATMEDLNKIAESLKKADPKFRVQLENDIFFDGADNELEKADAVLRLRKTTLDDPTTGQRKYSVTLKEQSEVEQGQSMRWEQKDTLTEEQANKFSQDPTLILSQDGLATVQGLKKHQIIKLVHIGSINTTRMTFQWADCQCQPGLTIRLDKTEFPFGDRYEMEVPHITVPLEDVINELSRVMKSIGVTEWSRASETKFQMLRGGTRDAAARPHMSVEAKLTLPTQDDFGKVYDALAKNKIRGENQENFFLDSPASDLAARGVMLRVRLDQVKSTCVVTIKEHSAVNDGGALCWTQEEAIPWNTGCQLKSNPNLLFEIDDSAILKALRDKYCIDNLSCLGGFTTVREHYNWPSVVCQPGLTIRLDKTTYPFGERFEMEVPGIRVPVEDVVSELEKILGDLGVSFGYGSASKYQQFRQGVAKSFVSAHLPN